MLKKILSNKDIIFTPSPHLVRFYISNKNYTLDKIKSYPCDNNNKYIIISRESFPYKINEGFQILRNEKINYKIILNIGDFYLLKYEN